MKIITAKKENLSVILKVLKDGKVLICPTDTVYGLICDATNEKAVEKIFKIKKRDKSKPLAVFVKDIGMAKEFAFINKNQGKFLKKNWPGAVTVILKAKKVPRLPKATGTPAAKGGLGGLSKLVYKDDTIGLRVPDCRFLKLISEKFNKPIAQTSANISGQTPSTRIKDVFKQVENTDVQPDLIINAEDLPQNKPSKVVDFTKNKIKILRR